MNDKVRRFSALASPHLYAGSGVNWVMLKVILALLPAIGVKIYLYGASVVLLLLATTLFCLFFEGALLLLRRRRLAVLADFSITVTALLLALALPTTAPWWLLFIGSGAAAIFGKGLYGGLGYNPFNPAMVAYIVLLIAFPANMSSWAAPLADLSWAQSWDIFIGKAPLDAVTAATALDYAKTNLKVDSLPFILNSPLYGQLGAAHEEWLALAYMLGGVLLLLLGIIPWQTPLAMLLSIIILATIGNLIDPEHYLSALRHLFSGAVMLGAFFIVTDPVSGCTSAKARFIFGALVGVLVYIIRSFGSYPDAVAFAVLIANMAAPSIDYFAKSRTFGSRNANR